MRIACFVPYSISSPGVKSRILPLMLRLENRGHSIELFSAVSNHGKYPDCEYGCGTIANKDPVRRLKVRTGIRNLLTNIKDCVSKFDAIYVFNPCLSSGPVGYGLAFLRRTPILMDIDDYVTSGSLIEKVLLKDLVVKALPVRAQRVVVASQELMRLYQQVKGLPVSYLPNSAELDVFTPTVKTGTSEVPTFVWCGTLESLNCEFLIKAFARVKNDGKLMIVGARPDGPALPRFLEETDLRGKSVIFTGLVPHRDVPRILASADVGLLPLRNSFHDRCKCPVKLYEYMAMELPVITVDYGEAAYMIRLVGCGMTSLLDPERFAHAMDEFIENFSYWRDRGKLGRRHLERYQNWDLLADRLESVLLALNS